MRCIFEADDGKQFCSEDECRTYEQEMAGFSFERNVVLANDGHRLIPRVDELPQAVNFAYYIKFRTAKDRGRFATLSKAVGPFACDYIQTFPVNQLEFAWLNYEKRFVPVREMLKFCQDAINQLDKHK